jgi:hypothetical protein
VNADQCSNVHVYRQLAHVIASDLRLTQSWTHTWILEGCERHAMAENRCSIQNVSGFLPGIIIAASGPCWLAGVGPPSVVAEVWPTRYLISAGTGRCTRQALTGKPARDAYHEYSIKL